MHACELGLGSCHVLMCHASKQQGPQTRCLGPLSAFCLSHITMLYCLALQGPPCTRATCWMALQGPPMCHAAASPLRYSLITHPCALLPPGSAGASMSHATASTGGQAYLQGGLLPPIQQLDGEASRSYDGGVPDVPPRPNSDHEVGSLG